MRASEALEVGQQAPEFQLKGPAGQFFSLSDYRGKQNVVLVFYPLAFSPVCSHQLPALQSDASEFARLDAVVLGISVDSHHANSAFARQLGVTFPLLSDFHRKTSAAYGVLDEQRGTSARALFVVDKQGTIAYRDVSADPALIPSPDRALEALRRLP
jgi:peroxiredoxin